MKFIDEFKKVFIYEKRRVFIDKLKREVEVLDEVSLFRWVKESFLDEF